MPLILTREMQTCEQEWEVALSTFGFASGFDNRILDFLLANASPNGDNMTIVPKAARNRQIGE
jgi:hypothetical protein